MKFSTLSIILLTGADAIQHGTNTMPRRLRGRGLVGRRQISKSMNGYKSRVLQDTSSEDVSSGDSSGDVSSEDNDRALKANRVLETSSSDGDDDDSSGDSSGDSSED